MNSAETAGVNTRFSLRSLLTLAVFAVLALIALNQYRQNLQLQRKLESLSAKIQHLEASGEHAQAKFDQLVDLVSNEPRLKVPPASN